jgi:transposase
MEVLYERVAGLDIGKATLTVCVRTPGPRGGRRAETRTYSTMTRSLQVMRDWLLECGVTIAAMESTSTYWKGARYKTCGKSNSRSGSAAARMARRRGRLAP